MLGRELTFEGQPDDEARAQLSQAMPAEYVDAFFRFYSAGTLDESRVRSDVSDVTGQPPRSFRQWARAHADAFSPARSARGPRSTRTERGPAVTLSPARAGGADPAPAGS